MVFTKGLHLARQSIAKTFTHGYAQSIVAGAQSSYATQSTSFGSFGSNLVTRLGKPGSSHSNSNAFHQSSQHSAAADKADQSGALGVDLAAYYTAWQKHQQRSEDKEWHQFQFAKRIAWKAPTTVPDGSGKSKEQLRLEEPGQAEAGRGTLERAYTTSAIDDFRKVVEDEGVEGQAIAQVDEAIAKEIIEVKEEAVTRSSANASPSVRSQYSASPGESVSPVGASSTTSISEAEVYTAHLVKLASGQQYGEIPALFESMLTAGVTPTPTAYNTLLAAAIHLPKSRHHVVPKALDVYSDMLRRKVLPNTVTYSTLIELLSNRALDVLSSKRGLEQKRVRYGSPPESYMFPSQQTESRILAEDDSMQLAIKLFDASTSSGIQRRFTPETYSLLVEACAEHGRVPDMVRIYTQMESVNVIPSATMFPPMVKAFAVCGDLRSSVECYDEYKALAISNNNGHVSMDRNDDQVYAALVKAYAICGRLSGGLKFLDKIEAAESTESPRTEILRETVALDSVLPYKLKEGLYDEILNDPALQNDRVTRALCIYAADAGRVEHATRAFDRLHGKWSSSSAASAMLACHIRLGNAEAASRYWEVLKCASPQEVDLVEPTVMRTVALIGGPEAGEAARECRQMFARIREDSGIGRNDIAEQVDEAISVIGHHLVQQGIFLPITAALQIMRSMVDNGGLIAPVAAHLLAGVGPKDIAQLSWDDLMLVTQVQAGMIINGSNFDIANGARFSHLLEAAMAHGAPADEHTAALVEKTLTEIDSPGLASRWHNHRYPVAQPVSMPFQFTKVHDQAYEDAFDPYASTTDFKGSSAITDELEKSYGRHANHLNDALARLRNMRRSGRHPRYITYAKLITAAAKENRINLAHDLLALARQDMPYVHEYRAVRHGWISLLDAMVGACLSVGKRDLAAQYHQDLLDLGAAPSANTYGLYITTLKESTKTFDEASEAVKIFLRAKSEGVEPSSFLYNALIGKLGKARRIDDCLLYFAEMRNLGIKPTSVTYGTIVNALCRVSDDKFAEELFEEMESMPNYKPRPAPYNSLMQYFLTTRRDRSKVLAYWERMKRQGIQPTMHTYKLLIDTHATLEPVNMTAAEDVLEEIRHSGIGQPEAVHYAALIHAKGCVLHDMPGARAIFDAVVAEKEIRPQPCLYQALFESMVANHAVAETEPLVVSMRENGVDITPYIANTLIHGWAMAGELKKAKRIFGQLGMERREPSTYEAMVKACLSGDDREGSRAVVAEACSRGYPAAVAGKIADLVRG